MMNLLIWLAIIVLGIIVLKFVAKLVVLTIGFFAMVKQEYDKQKILNNMRGKK